MSAHSSAASPSRFSLAHRPAARAVRRLLASLLALAAAACLAGLDADPRLIGATMWVAALLMAAALITAALCLARAAGPFLRALAKPLRRRAASR